ncbi:nucleoprotein TPR-like isoform X3 [Hydractinia symbiolongicarpus]|uniref:nucleoprotein TPR-like isoform X3 n=1 Tax=Hydractinia symbiolongicarpus TaxID=13093 RepID=UPI00254A82B5|nr:nucleoprotein TPR-like isoform X3 [Hydractinia symbiolongicarpus]
MEDAIKVLSTKFDLQSDVLQKIGSDSENASSWLMVLGAYVLDNDKKLEEQATNEVLLRKQRLNAEHQLSQLEKQLISANSKLNKYEKSLLTTRTKLERLEESQEETEKKYEETLNNKQKIERHNEQLKQKSILLEQEKCELAEVMEKKNKEIDRLNEEWNEMSTKLADANTVRYQLQYKLDEIKNSDVRKEFKEKRLEQEKSMLLQQIEQMTSDLKTKSAQVVDLNKDKSAKLLGLESKCETLQQENAQFKAGLEASKKTCLEQERKIEMLLAKLKRIAEEHIEVESNMQQELTAQNKLVQLYKEDRDHVKAKLDEVTTAISELQALLKQSTEDKSAVEVQLASEHESLTSKIQELEQKIKNQSLEIENANDLLQISKRKGDTIMSKDLSFLSPVAAASSKILKKGMTLTQIYSEYVKVTDELLNEKDENARLKLYMEQILQEVEEKAPLLLQQKEDYEHARQTIDNMSAKMEQNIRECNRLQNEHDEYERKVGYHKREEKRLKTLCVDLSQQVRVLLKEVEEARGGAVSSPAMLLVSPNDDLNVSSSGQVISEHLVTFKSIEELQAQNERLLLTVRELSEEQEKLEQEGGPEIIHELKKKIEHANFDLDTLKDNQRVQDEMLEKLSRQRDMYKVLCQKGGVMVGDVSSTSALGSQTILETEAELTTTKAELDNTISEHMKLKEVVSKKEKSLNNTINSQEEQLSSIRLERDKLKNQLEFTEEKHSILKTTADGYKREVKALEAKCSSITEALNTIRVEAAKYKQEYSEAKEKLIAAEVNAKSMKTEKNLVKEAEKRLMQENQSLLDQQRSQNVLLTNLQTIQNNLERREFETRSALGKQVDSLQREVRALRRQSDNETSILKSTNTSLEKEIKELKIKLGIEMEKNKIFVTDSESSKHLVEQLEAKCKELESISTASERRLTEVLKREASGSGKDDNLYEVEWYKTKVRELELIISNAATEKKALEDQLEVAKKHSQQYEEIANSNEQAINIVNEKLDAQVKEFEKKLSESNETVKSLNSRIASVVAEKVQMRKSSEQMEKKYQLIVSELRTQSAPLERRFQEVTRALVHAKEMETAAVKESHVQAELAKETQEKYERELLLHAKDVEQLTILKQELHTSNSRYGGMEEQFTEMKRTLKNNEELMTQMKGHHNKELRKGESTRKDLIDQNAILHGQVEKLSAQLASAKSQERGNEGQETSSDKSVEEVYELLRFVRREKEIAETKAEASETESMRYRQRAEHLQRDLDENKAALELELERTKGRMLTEEEHNDIMEKVKKGKEYEVLNKDLEQQKAEQVTKAKTLLEKVTSMTADMKSLQESKKALESEKSSWLAEKTALKAEIDRWTNRTNQLMAQNTKSEAEELKKLQIVKNQNEKTIIALQDDMKRTKQQLDVLKRESLKLRSEKTESQNKIASLQTELNAAKSPKPTTTTNGAEPTELTTLKKELEDIKKNMQKKTSESQQLRKVAKKYKTQSDKLQKLLTEHQINFTTIFTATTSAIDPSAQSTTPAGMETDEKKKLESSLAENIKMIEDLTKQLADLQAKYDADLKSYTEKESRFKQETLSRSTEAEKKLLGVNKEIEDLRSELSMEKENKEEKNKLLKTAKYKITSLTRIKEAKAREADTYKKQVDELKKQKETLTEQTTLLNSLKEEFELKIDALESQVEELVNEKEILTERVKELQNRIDVQEKKENSKFKNVATQQKTSRVQSLSQNPSKSAEVPSSIESSAPLTATVRPTATPNQPVSKFHPQTITPTASIRPLAHAAPTAMISPTPVTQSVQAPTPVPSVSALPITALPITAPVSPQVAEIQGRAASSSSRLAADRSFKAPVARVTVQVQERDVDVTDIVPNIDEEPALEAASSTSDDASRVPSSKRCHADLEMDRADSDVVSLGEDEGEEPGVKRQRIEPNEDQQLETDPQEGLEEDELLAEVAEDGDDDAMEGPTDAVPLQSGIGSSRENQLQVERSLQRSPQELLRQRSHPRVRAQLPSFSLMPQGQGHTGYYEDTDDSTVPSTPTLYMPKRTDGFAEAVSSPLVRLPTFSFSTHEQPPSSSNTPALDQTGVHLDETRVDLMGAEDQVPQTPLSIVPSNQLVDQSQPPLSQEESEDQSQETAISEDNGQEQNVPQQIDLTEEDDDEDDDNQEIEEENVEEKKIDGVKEDHDESEGNESEEGNEGGSEQDIEEEEEEDFEEAEVVDSNSEDEPESSESHLPIIVERSGDVKGNPDDIVKINKVEIKEGAELDAAQGKELDAAHSVPGERLSHDTEAEGEKEPVVVISAGDDVTGTAANQPSSSSVIEQKRNSIEGETQEQAKVEDKPKPVRLQRAAGTRPRLRRTAPPGKGLKQDGSEK